jgi:hypothetical protein
MQRYFTQQEANDLLPVLKPLIKAMFHARDELLTLQPELQETLEKAINNGNSHVSRSALDAMGRLKDAVAKVHSFGVEVKDVNRGLIDFPSLRNGEIVYLCWIFGEEQVGFWHTLEAGFAGRQPLTD